MGKTILGVWSSAGRRWDSTTKWTRPRLEPISVPTEYQTWTQTRHRILYKLIIFPSKIKRSSIFYIRKGEIIKYEIITQQLFRQAVLEDDWNSGDTTIGSFREMKDHLPCPDEFFGVGWSLVQGISGHEWASFSAAAFIWLLLSLVRYRMWPRTALWVSAIGDPFLKM